MKHFFLFKDFLILEINCFEIFLSTISKHCLKLIEFSFIIFDILGPKFEPIIIE